MTPEEFNHLSSNVVPVLTNARPYGAYSMVDIDRVGGVQVIVRELLETGLLNGDVITCTGRTLGEQVADLNTPEPDGDVIYPVQAPYKLTGGLRVLGGNLSPDFSAILKLAGVEGGLEDNYFRGNARIFEGEADLLTALDRVPEVFRIMTWSSFATRGRVAHRVCRRCLIPPHESPRSAGSGTLSLP